MSTKLYNSINPITKTLSLTSNILEVIKDVDIVYLQDFCSTQDDVTVSLEWETVGDIKNLIFSVLTNRNERKIPQFTQNILSYNSKKDVFFDKVEDNILAFTEGLSESVKGTIPPCHNQEDFIKAIKENEIRHEIVSIIGYFVSEISTLIEKKN